ncbi:MAG: carbohydrate ABC transporter substrate-binding protein [Anaerolineae bacterium]|nr:carbohydrate ABC transporter substrate-binding protein [Anaerolineae bacterium]
MRRKVIGVLVSVLMLITLFATACGTATPTEEAPATEEPEAREFEGETVSVIATWGGDEQESFMAMIAPWEERTGATVEYEGTRDLNAVLNTRVEGGNPPDVAGLPGPAVLQQFAADGHLVDLNTFLDQATLEEQYDDSWLELASFEGGLYGLFTKVAVKSLIWYNPKAFDAAGYAIPESWDELLALSDQIVADGGTPWCIGLESGAASGWPGTDWIEDIVLRTAGAETYDQWRRHEIPWTDDAVRNAWETWGTIVTNEDYLDGGTTGVLATNFGESPYPMFQDPPGCYMHRQATFIEGFITDQFPDLVAQEDYDYFGFPEIDPEYGTPVLSAGDLFGMFNDTPSARSLVEWLASAEAQQIWAERGGFISPNKNVSSDVYPNPLIGQAAGLLTSADVVRFDASDLMPAAVNDAFSGGILNYVENPENLDQILQNIETAAAEAYGE